MTTHEDHTLGEGTVAEPPALVWAPGPGHAYPATAGGVPLSAFAFAFAVTFLGLVETGIVSSAANDIFLATCFGIGAVGLFIGGMWEFRGGELFGGTFGVGYAGFLFSTALILKFFAAPMIAAAGVANFGDRGDLDQLDRGRSLLAGVHRPRRPGHRQPRRHGELDKRRREDRRVVRARRRLRRGVPRRGDRPQRQHGQGTPAALPDEVRQVLSLNVCLERRGLAGPRRSAFLRRRRAARRRRSARDRRARRSARGRTASASARPAARGSPA